MRPWTTGEPSRQRQTNKYTSFTSQTGQQCDTRNVLHTRKQDGVNNDRTSKDEYSEVAPKVTQIFRRVRGDAGLGAAVLAE
jgi:ribosome-binding protein aMBF1 (putative translation factor)